MGIIVILPICIYTFFRTIENRMTCIMAKRIMYTAYVFECVVAILERILRIRIFQLKISGEIMSLIDTGITEFRSIGLYGHPLQNALVVFIFINFILIYERNNRNKRQIH